MGLVNPNLIKFPSKDFIASRSSHQFTYNTYLQRAICYKEIGKYDLARESLEKGERSTQTCFCGIEMRKEWKIKKDEILAEIEKLEAKS